MADLVRVDGPHGGVATITLNRPEKRNALSIALRDGVSDALDRLAADDDCKVVVVTGAGEVFSAGFDLREFEQLELADELWASSDRFHRSWLEFPLPTVPADELMAQAMETASAIARAPRDVLQRTKAKFIRRAQVVTGKTPDL